MDKRQEQIELGQRAQVLLNDPALQAAFSELFKSYYDAWRTSDVADAEGRERLFYTARAADNLLSHLNIVLQTGKLAQVEVDKIKARKVA